MKKVYFNSLRCLGCRSCEFACAVQHSQTKDPMRAPGEAEKPIPRRNIQMADGMVLTMACRHCNPAPCADACIGGALSRDYEAGSVDCDSNKCVGCWMCVMVCPFDAVKPGHVFSVKCDMCEDRASGPACVGACPTGALFEATPEEFAQRTSQKTSPSLKVRWPQ